MERINWCLAGLQKEVKVHKVDKKIDAVEWRLTTYNSKVAKVWQIVEKERVAIVSELNALVK